MTTASHFRLTLEHYQSLLAELHAAQSERRQLQDDLRRFDEEHSGSGELSLGEQERRAKQRYEQDLTALAERQNQELRVIEERFAADSAQTEQNYLTAVDRIDREFSHESAKIERKFQEDSWMASSIMDEKSDASPQRQLEKLAGTLQVGQERLTTLKVETNGRFDQFERLRESWRQEAPEIGSVDLPVNDRAAALQGATDAAEAVRIGMGHLQHDVLFRLLDRRILGISLLPMWGAMFVPLYFACSPEWVGIAGRPGIEWPLITGGVGFGLACLLIMTLHFFAVHRFSKFATTFLRLRAEQQFFSQRWQKFAKEEMRATEQKLQDQIELLQHRRDKSLQQFAANRDRRASEIRERQAQQLSRADRDRETALAAAAELRQRESQVAEAAYHSDLAELKQIAEQELDKLARGVQRELSERDLRRRDLESRAEQMWQGALNWFAAASADLAEESRREFPTWEEIVSASWQASVAIPHGIRIGDYRVAPQSSPESNGDLDSLSTQKTGQDPATSFLLPAVIPFPAQPSLLLEARGIAGRDCAVSILQTTLLRLLAHIPPGDLRMTIVDPIGLGENFSAFMHLADYDELFVSSRIWTEPSHIEQQLANLTEHMENVFQKYLRNEFESIEQYNEQAGEVAEPYRVLIVANFPAGFTERAAQRLSSIVASGPRCGVFTLLSIDVGQPAPRGFDLAAFESATNVFDWNGAYFMQRKIAGTPLPLIPDAPPPALLWGAIVRKLGELSRHGRRVEVPFHRIVPRDEAIWQESSRSQIEAPLGRSGATKLQHLQLGRGTSQHVLIAGKTGSGKSTLLHVIITNLALRYSPQEIEFYLIDFKKGVEFKTYATHHLPHARVIAIESDREFGVSTLERLDAVLKERGDLFRQAGVQDLAAFRTAQPDVEMPRILLMVDEFQEFFVEDDKFSQTAALLLDRLVRQGRAFGIHVLLGSQTLGGAYSLARTTIGQMAVRIALQCSETDAHLILSENNTAARLLTRPGEALYNDANGLLEGNHPFQVAWLDDDQRDGYLARIQQFALDRCQTIREPIVFEGNIPADPRRNGRLQELISAAVEKGGAVSASNSPYHAWLGDAVAITGPTQVLVQRRSGSNLLVVGGDEAAARGMLQTAFIALALRREFERGSSHLEVDENASSTEDSTPPGVWIIHNQSAENSNIETVTPWRRLIDLVGPTCQEFGPSATAKALQAVHAELSRRRPSPALTAWPACFLIIDDLSRYRDLRKSEDDFGFGSSREKGISPGEMLAEVLREGPPFGVHVVVWCDSYNNLERWFSRQTVREFEMRVVLQMSSADSSHIIDSPAAAKLGVNRALFYSDERGTIEKFRPYGIPQPEWINEIEKRLAHEEPVEPELADDINQWQIL